MNHIARPNDWLVEELKDRKVDLENALECANFLYAQDINTMGAMAGMTPDEFSDQFLQNIGVKSMGMRKKLLGLHEEVRKEFADFYRHPVSGIDLNLASLSTADDVIALVKSQKKLENEVIRLRRANGLSEDTASNSTTAKNTNDVTTPPQSSLATVPINRSVATSQTTVRGQVIVQAVAVQDSSPQVSAQPYQGQYAAISQQFQQSQQLQSAVAVSMTSQTPAQGQSQAQSAVAVPATSQQFHGSPLVRAAAAAAAADPNLPPRTTGYLSKQGRLFKSWKKRFFILDRGMLTYYATQAATSPLGSSMSMRGCTIIQTHPTELLLTNSYRTLRLAVPDSNQTVAWTAAFNQHVAYLARPR